MGDNQYQSDNHRTFSQRYGYAPLPDPMQLEELSDYLRIEIWNAIRGDSYVNQKSTVHEYHTEYYFNKEPSLFIERVLGRVLIIARR